MYEPNVKITAGLQNSLKEIEDVRDLLKTIPMVPIIEKRIQRQALVETVYYTARIEGNPLDIRAVERLASHQVLEPKSDNEQEHLNLYKVMDFIRHIADQPDIPIDEEVVKQIHAFVVRDISSQGSPGVYKAKPNAIVDKTTRERIYLPPRPSKSVRLMGELSAWLSQRPMVVHPVITAGLSHLELVAIHPFDNGNGRTARALADLILYRYGYKLRYLFSWVKQVGIGMDTYHQKLRQVLGAEYGANNDPTIWLEYFADSVAKSLVEKKPELIKIQEYFATLYSVGTEKGLTKDQIEALVYAQNYGGVTTGHYMNATGLSRSTVVKRLNELVEGGIMRVEGKGRNVRYIFLLTEKS